MNNNGTPPPYITAEDIHKLLEEKKKAGAFVTNGTPLPTYPVLTKTIDNKGFNAEGIALGKWILKGGDREFTISHEQTPFTSIFTITEKEIIIGNPNGEHITLKL